MINVVFVCTGNTCRSAMAEYLFRDLLKKRSIDTISVSSAGVAAFPDDLASDCAEQVLDERGIDMSGHRARHLTSEIIEEADIILTMMCSHRDLIVHRVPKAENKTYVLKPYALRIGAEKNDADIRDPYGMSVVEYRNCAEEINQLLIKLLEPERGLINEASNRM